MINEKRSLQKLTGAEKTAIFLFFMGEEYTSTIFSRLRSEEISKIACAMANLDEIPPEVLNTVLDEFNFLFEDKSRLLVGGEYFLKNVIDKSISKESADAIFREIEETKREKPFKWSRNINISTLAGYLKSEHPQTIAMVLANLPPEISAEIMIAVPDEKKGDLALRIAQLGEVPEEVIREVDEAIKSELGSVVSGKAKGGGIRVLADILNNVDKATEDAVMETIEEEQREMANEIRQLMFVFEDLITVDDRGIREILKKIESSQLTLALKTASEELSKKILGNLSTRVAEMLLEDLEVMGPVRLSEVEQAQQEIINAAKELEADGTITLGRKGSDEILV